MTIDAAAAELCMHPGSLRRWIAARKFPAVRRGTRSILVRRSDIEAFIAANLVRADPRVALDGLPDDAVEEVRS
jgi:excisionase family DNA binding protein